MTLMTQIDSFAAGLLFSVIARLSQGCNLSLSSRLELAAEKSLMSVGLRQCLLMPDTCCERFQVGGRLVGAFRLWVLGRLIEARKLRRCNDNAVRWICQDILQVGGV